MEIGEFRQEHESFEFRIKEFVETKIKAYENRVNEQQEQINENKAKFDEDLAETQK